MQSLTYATQTVPSGQDQFYQHCSICHASWMGKEQLSSWNGESFSYAPSIDKRWHLIALGFGHAQKAPGSTPSWLLQEITQDLYGR